MGEGDNEDDFQYQEDGCEYKRGALKDRENQHPLFFFPLLFLQSFFFALLFLQSYLVHATQLQRRPSLHIMQNWVGCAWGPAIHGGTPPIKEKKGRGVNWFTYRVTFV